MHKSKCTTNLLIMIKRYFKWFLESNRYKHFMGGFGIGFLSCNAYCATLVGVSVGGAMEFKDWQWGGKPDLIDFAMTILGTAIGFGTRLVMLSLLHL